MAMSPRGLAAVVCEEAIVTVIYEDKDTKGVIHLANGIGNNDDSMDPKLVITPARAVDEFLENIKRFEAVVAETITRPLKSFEEDALVSRAFNSGVTGFRVGQRKLIAAVNQGDTLEVVLQLLRSGNKKRRAHESLMFAAGEYIDYSKVRLYEVNPKVLPERYTMIPNPIMERFHGQV